MTAEIKISRITLYPRKLTHMRGFASIMLTNGNCNDTVHISMKKAKSLIKRFGMKAYKKVNIYPNCIIYQTQP
jgi:hypothetical protein